MNPQQEINSLNAFIDELLDTLHVALDSGEQLSDELQGAIADELEQAYVRLDELNFQTSAAPPADAQLLWYLSGQNEQSFINYLRQYPSPQTAAILADKERLTKTIDYMQRIAPPQERQMIDGIQHADLNSSNIWGTAYNPQTRQMKVRFQGGAEYLYDKVPPNIYRAFSQGNADAKTKGKNQYGEWWVGKNPSLGAALNQYIKAGNFNYRRIA